MTGLTRIESARQPFEPGGSKPLSNSSQAEPDRPCATQQPVKPDRLGKRSTQPTPRIRRTCAAANHTVPMNRFPIFLRHTVTLLVALGLQACAQQAIQPKTSPTSTQVSHACQPVETVGFSCELQDGRLLSLCASSGFNEFEGAPADNPGYAYLAIGAKQGQVSYTYPPNPRDYKEHMYFWVSISAVPHMFVSSNQGAFLHLSLDIDSPVNVTHENAPKGWPLSSSADRSLCTSQINRDHLDPFMAQMVKKADWERARRETLLQGSTAR